MRFTGWIFTALLSLGLSAHATSGCISVADMQEIAKHFSQFSELSNKGEYCPDGSATSRLLQGIMFMRQTPFAKSMPKSADELFSGNFASSWWDYFVERINEFSVEDSCPKGVVAFVYGFGTTMYVCPNALTENFTSLDLSSVFMHEARHIDGYPHVTCSRGPRAGISGACDNRISDQGSYAVTVETYAQIARYAEDLHPALKAYARSASVIYADEAFENPVRINRRQQLLLLTNTRDFYKLDGTNLTQLGQSPLLGHVVMRGQFMVLFPEDKTQTARFVFARNEGEIHQQAGELAGEYNGQTPAQRADLVDIHIGAQWSARVYHNRIKFTCSATRPDERMMDLQSGQVPSSLLYPNGYDRSAKSTVMITEDGRLFDIGCDSSATPYVRPSNLTLDQPYKRIQKVGQQVVGLSRDGRLFEIRGNSSTALQTSIDGKIYDMVPNQNVEFFDKAD